jgi:hypothetical protein
MALIYGRRQLRLRIAVYSRRIVIYGAIRVWIKILPDALLTTQDRQEALSRAYVTAVAAAAGYVTAEQDFDRDGVDIQVRAGGQQRPSLDIQLKATTRANGHESDEFRYPLKRRNYDLLIEPTMVPPYM